jgi:hypothetical protein
LGFIAHLYQAIIEQPMQQSPRVHHMCGAGTPALRQGEEAPLRLA